MAICDPKIHERFRPLAEEDELIAGTLEDLRIRGNVLFKVHRGPYSKLGSAWGDFFERFKDCQKEWAVAGPPGDLYVCSPAAHAEDGFRELLTVLYCPVKRRRTQAALAAKKKAAGKKTARKSVKKPAKKKAIRKKATKKKPARKKAGKKTTRRKR